MELFVALDVPLAVKRELRNIQNHLRQFDSSGKYESAENFHLTLSYIGEWTSQETIISHLEHIRFNSFELQLHEPGIFENPGKSVVWVNVKENDRLHALQQMIVQALANAGVLINRFVFVPHISLAYGCNPSISSSFSACKVIPLSFEVSSFYLYVVHSVSESTRFKKLRNFKLF
ncbi:RNA 2',3'-cyclic phosphodiesterase [Paenibacillus filicis]|uniref:RNA 2',3'-cyclic phosphodiesterase n=1 Tax=Paenibacillus gyeongsangnamensis TaxID=3388067 RepID=A0ABT4Q470_9BACL|nr:RNA 2',3'-cyclic phosphodiesterase [Paenibacillus filicis]MCZ8511582.1 RNA 2',3'-cyclic phosphodiesterase [Paenibacillus filicis]